MAQRKRSCHQPDNLFGLRIPIVDRENQLLQLSLDPPSHARAVPCHTHVLHRYIDKYIDEGVCEKIQGEQAEMLSGVLDVASAQHVTKQEIGAQVVMLFT